MTMIRTYAHGYSHGDASDQPEIVTAVYGPRGGKQAVFCLSAQQARELAANLVKAANELTTGN